MKIIRNGFLIVAAGVSIAVGFSEESLSASQLPAGAKYIALGGMTATSTNDVYALRYNPARLTAVSSLQFAAEFTSMFAGMDNAPARKFIAAALPVPGVGNFGVYGDLFEASGLSRESMFGAGYARAGLFGIEGLDIGGTIKYFRYEVQRPDAVYDDNGVAISGAASDPLFANGTSKAVFSCSLGALYRFDQRWSVGLAADDITEPNISLIDTPGVILPRQVYGGVSATFGAMSYNLDLGTVDRDCSAAFGVQRSFASPLNVFASVRHTQRRYTAKTVDLTEPSIGMSYSFQGFILCYAARYPLNGLDTYGDHTLSLLYTFATPASGEGGLQ